MLPTILYSGAVALAKIFDLEAMFGISYFTAITIVCIATGVIGMFRSIHCDEIAAAVEQVRATASMISAALGYRPDRAT